MATCTRAALACRIVVGLVLFAMARPFVCAQNSDVPIVPDVQMRELAGRVWQHAGWPDGKSRLQNAQRAKWLAALF
jgi:hypothetical protein